jgi:proton glutamate symport protein
MFYKKLMYFHFMKNSMLFKVLIAIVLAVVAGLLTQPGAGLFGVTYVQMYHLIGKLFLNALSLVVVPLVAASIITGTARMGVEQSFGTLGLKTFGYFILTSLLAILIGLFLTVLIEPGTASQGSILSSVNTEKLAEIKHQAEGNAFDKIEEILLKTIPPNILAAASQNQMLGLIIFCLVFGYFIAKTDAHTSSIILGFFKGVFQIMMQITQLVMKALPIGVFGLVAKAIATTGLETIGAVAYYFGTVLLGLFVYAFIVLPLMLKFIAGVSPLAHIRAMMPALVTAFSTTSSAATLPVSLECVEKKAGVSNRISSLILPLGTSINLSGSALYVCAGVVFIAQAYGVHLSIPSMAVVIFLTLITSLGSAGIPSASLFSIVVILQALGLPADGIGLIMAVERILDMFRTPVNVFGTSCCAVLVARSEGEKDILVPAKLETVTSEQNPV